jgi:hypothetical protein
MPDKQGPVRQVHLKTKTGTLIRPVAKLCLLLEADTPEQEISCSAPKHDEETAKDQGQLQSETTKNTKNSNQIQTSSGRLVKPRKRLDL